MSLSHLGAQKKRTNTPVANRRRVVEYRHKKYVPIVAEDLEDKLTTATLSASKTTKKKDTKKKDTKKKSTKKSKKKSTTYELKDGTKITTSKKKGAKKKKKQEQKPKEELEKKKDEVLEEEIKDEILEEEIEKAIAEEVVAESEIELEEIELAEDSEVEATTDKQEKTLIEKSESVAQDAWKSVSAFGVSTWDKIKGSASDLNEKRKENKEKRAEEKAEREPRTAKQVVKDGYQYLVDRHNSFMDYIIDEPKANIFKMIFSPAASVKNVASADNITMNVLALLFLNVVHWIAFGTFIAYGLSLFINSSGFSIARMNFTGAAKIVFLISLFATVFQYLSFNVISIYCGLFKDKVSASKLSDISGRAAPFTSILYLISAFLLKHNPVIGIGLFIASCILSIMLFTLGLTTRVKSSLTKLAPIIILCVVVSTVCFWRYFILFSADLIKIFEVILNI